MLMIKKLSHLLLASLLFIALMPAVTQRASGTTVAPFDKSVKTSATQSMLDIFKNLASGNFDKAFKTQQALEKEMQASSHTEEYAQAIYPLYDLSKAMILARPEGAGAGISLGRNLWEAENLVRNVYVRAVGIDEANDFLSHDDIQLSVDLIKNGVEKQLIDYTMKKNTIENYERLISILDEHNPAYAKAKAQLANLQFDRMCVSGDGCREYMQAYPESPRIAEAQKLTMNYDFKLAHEVNSVEHWKLFIKNYQLIPGAESYIEQAQAMLKNAEDALFFNSTVTLAQLDAYAATTRRDLNNKIFRLYDNLINLPTHSYRYMSLKLNFAGITGRVQEKVVENAGTNNFINYFVFNKQGLLEEVYNGRHKTLTKYTYGFNKSHGFYLISKTVGTKNYPYSCTYDPATGHLSKVSCADGTSMTYEYDNQGRLTGRTEVDNKGKKKTSTYKSGKMRTEQNGNIMLKFLKYDGSHASEIDVQSDKKNSKWNYEYQLDDHARWTQAKVTVDSKPRLVITRTYSE